MPLDDSISTILNDKEKRVLDMRFGISTQSPMTLEEVGKVFGVTRERIRQIEARALLKLRRSPRIRFMRDFLEN